MKKCPFCAEKIQDEAVVCRYCGKELPKTETIVKTLNKDKTKRLRIGLILLGVIILLVGGFFLIKSLSSSTNDEGMKIVYFENFDDASKFSGWESKLIDDTSQVVVRGGVYWFTSNGGYLASILRSEKYTDTVINLEIDFLTPEQTNAVVMCRNDEKFYSFTISSSGHWNIDINDRKLLSGDNVIILPERNKVTVSCVGNTLSLALNEIELGSVQDSELTGGQIGLAIESGGTTEVTFDNLTISEPTTQTVPHALPDKTATTILTNTPLPLNTPTPQATSTTTPTPTIAATLRPTAIPTDEVLLYQTDFEDNDASLANWTTFAYSYPADIISTEGYEVKTGTSYYRFRATQTNQRIFSIYDEELNTSDVDISLERPMYDQGNVGLVCRYSDAGWYQFMMEGLGRWSIRLSKFDNSGKLQFSKLATGIVPNSTRLRAECKGDRLTLYVDGILVSSLHDDTFPQGKVGVLGWSFDQTGQVAFVDKFSIKRAEWRESDLAGPAPTSGADGVIYQAQFNNMNDFDQYWFSFGEKADATKRNAQVVSGAGYARYYYVNDFDPGTGDIEINADTNGSGPDGLICRYSEDGWYEATFGDSPAGIYLSLTRVERGSDGTIKNVWLSGGFIPKVSQRKIILSCVGNQISASVNGKVYVYAEDNQWTTGRFGLLVWDDQASTLLNTFSSYIVRPLTPIGGEEIPLLADDFEDEAASKSKWIIRAEESEHIQFTDGTVILSNSGLSSPNSTLRNVEVSMEMEFLSDQGGPMGFNCSLGMFGFSSDGNWDFRGEGDFFLSSNNSPSPLIKPDKNEVTFRCYDGQFTFSANGETVVNIENLTYNDDRQRSIWFGTYSESQIKIDNVTLSAISSALPVLPSPALPNQVVLPPNYEPGEIIYQEQGNENELLHEQVFWTRWIVTEQPSFDPQSGIVIPNVDAPIGWFSIKDMNNQPVELSATVNFTDDKGGMGFICRNNRLGRYEFMIQPNGSWVIRRNSSYWWDPKVGRNINILAQGTTEVITPTENDITTTCQGTTLTLTVNGEQLASLEDDLYPEGEIAIWFEPHTPASFKDLTVKAPN